MFNTYRSQELKTRLLILLLIGVAGAILVALVISPLVYATNGFVRHEIDTSSHAEGAFRVSPIDFDNDGDLDVVGGAFFADEILWYENDGEGNFTRHIVSDDEPTTKHPIGVEGIDFDFDGDTDVVAALQGIPGFAWYENDGTNDFFTYHPIVTGINAAAAFHAEPVDFDFDGDMDVVTSAENADEFAWYENDGTGTNFTRHVIEQGLLADPALHIDPVDFDFDGDMDVVTSGGNAFSWYENDGTDTSFTRRLVDDTTGGARAAQPYDFDYDGDYDVVVSSGAADEFIWYENDGTNNSFAKHVIAYVNAIYGIPIDFDDDGDTDLVTTSNEETSRFAWYENDGTDTNFIEHVVYQIPINLVTGVNVGDFNGDGLKDIIIGNRSSVDPPLPYPDEFTWFETVILKGTVYSDEGVTPLGGKTVALSVNGGETLGVDLFTTTADTQGVFQFDQQAVGATQGDTLTAYLDDELEKGSVVTVAGERATSDLTIYQDHFIVRNDDSGLSDTAILATGDTSDSDDLFTTSGGDITIGNIYSADLFIPYGQKLTATDNIIIGDSDTVSGLSVAGVYDADNSDTTISGDVEFVPLVGSILAGTGTMTVEGGWTDTRGGMQAETGTVSFVGTGTITGISKFHNISIGSSGEITTLASDLLISTGMLTIGDGIVLDGTPGEDVVVTIWGQGTAASNPGSDISTISFDYEAPDNKTIVAGSIDDLLLDSNTPGTYSLSGNTTVLNELRMFSFGGTNKLITNGYDLTVSGPSIVGVADIFLGQLEVSGGTIASYGPVAGENGSEVSAIVITDGVLIADDILDLGDMNPLAVTNPGGFISEEGGYIMNPHNIVLDVSGGIASITITDGDENLSATTTESVMVRTTLGSDIEDLELSETGQATGIFFDSFTIETATSTSFNGILEDPTGSAELAVFYADGEDPTDVATSTVSTSPPDPPKKGGK